MRPTAAFRSVARERHFLRYFTGESISSLGDAMSEVTIVVLALALAQGSMRPIAVALASAAYLVPGIVSGAVAGRSIGRMDPRQLALIDNGWRGAWIGIAAVLAITHQLDLWLYLVLLGMASLTRPLGAAGSRGLVARLVQDRLLFAANSLLSSSVQAATMLGPAAAGLLAAALGPGVALAIDGLSFLIFAGLLVTIRISGAGGVIKAGGVPLKTHGWRFWLGQPRVIALFTMTSIMLVLYGPLVTGLPLLVNERAGSLSTPTLLGLVWSAFGVGAVAGGLMRGGSTTLATVRAACLISAGWGACTLVVGLPAPAVVMCVAMLAGGFIYAPYNAIVSTILQRTLAPGRLAEASAYLESAKGVTVPAGLLAGGFAIAQWGAPATLIVCGIALTVIALGLAVRWREERLIADHAMSPALGGSE